MAFHIPNLSLRALSQTGMWNKSAKILETFHLVSEAKRKELERELHKNKQVLKEQRKALSVGSGASNMGEHTVHFAASKGDVQHF